MMKYGESIFDIAYLIAAIAIGAVILIRSNNQKQRLMGIACLVLGFGDAFHLIPRVLNYFIDGDFDTAIGVGKLVTSVTMTVFYILLYHIYLRLDGAKENRLVTVVVYLLGAVRILLCCLPQNRWFENDSPFIWGVLRNIPFVILGALIVVLFLSKNNVPRLRFVWLYITLSFLFYIIVVLGASAVSALGALMLPKTICYILIMIAFLRHVKEENA